MSEMNSLTLNGKTYDCFVDDVARSSVVICSASGESIAVSDSSGQPFVGLNLYGKSTQAGTPTPDAPVDIISVGDNGSVDLSIYGKVLTDWSSTTLVGKPIFSYKGNKIQYENNSGEHCMVSGVPLTLPVGTYTAYVRDLTDTANIALVGVKGLPSTRYLSHGTPRIVLSITQPTTISLIATTSNQTEKLAYSCYVGIVVGDVSIENCPKIDEKIPSIQMFESTALLSAVPVTDKTLATYTDANEQMWCADEIDLERGLYIQRVRKITLTGKETLTTSNVISGAGYYRYTYKLVSPYLANVPNASIYNGYCTHYEKISADDGYNAKGLNKTSVQYTDINFYVPYATMDEFKAFLVEQNSKGTPIEVVYRLATPIETALTDEEIAAYKALHTNKPNTTVLNDSGAFMSVKYIADVKSYIDNKVSGILTATVE